MRRVLILVAAAALSACSPKAPADEGQYGGLEPAILAWHKQISTTQAACLAKDGKGCQGFSVGCKGARILTSADQARGVTAKLVVAMSWEGWDTGRGEYRSQSGFSEFSKIDGTWQRADTNPVNLSTCAGA